MRSLWLAYERSPHPDAVAFAAGEEDVRLVLDWFALPYAERRRLSGQLRRFLDEQAALPVFDRQRVPCRRASGLYHLVPWRLAKWLACVLPADDAVIERTTARLRQWLDAACDAPVVNPY